MHILICHNRYGSKSPSGEDIVADREIAILKKESAVKVSSWELHSDDLINAGILEKLRIAWQLPGSSRRIKKFETQLKTFQPDVIHVHNLWPLFTYDLLIAAHHLNIPTVLTLHNYRLMATNTGWIESSRMKMANSREERIEAYRLGANHRNFLINHAYHRALKRLWMENIPQVYTNIFICLSHFQQERLVAAGIPRSSISIKPNFLDYQGSIGSGNGDYILFVGRLDSTKGIKELIEAWPLIGLKLLIVGDGPFSSVAIGHPNIFYLGPKSHSEVLALMKNARFLIMNSTRYETFGLVIIEAFAVGTPCLVPDLGGPAEIVSDGILGRVFRHGDTDHLVKQAHRLWDEAPTFRAACRQEYENHYTYDHHSEFILKLYSDLCRQGFVRE